MDRSAKLTLRPNFARNRRSDPHLQTPYSVSAMQTQPKSFPDPFADPIRNALHTAQLPLAQIHGLARKFPADITPFAAVEENSLAAMQDLLTLLEPGEATWLFHDIPPEVDGLAHETTLPCLQMVFPPGSPIPDHPVPSPPADNPILSLTCAHAPEMVALTDIAFPGFFRPRTCIMGNYYGIRDAATGALIALGGERQRMAASDGTPWIELSAVCTHPAHRGHGYARLLIHHLLRDHRQIGAVSCLHVSSANHTAIALYHRLGFQTLREVTVHRVRRTPKQPSPAAVIRFPS